MDAKKNETIGNGIVGAEGARNERTHELEAALVGVLRSQLGIQKLETPFHHHAVPIEEAAHLVDLECAPGIVRECYVLATATRPAIEPIAGHGVVDRLNVHAIVEGESNASHVVTPEQRPAFVVGQLAKDRETRANLRSSSVCSWVTPPCGLRSRRPGQIAAGTAV